MITARIGNNPFAGGTNIIIPEGALSSIQMTSAQHPIGKIVIVINYLKKFALLIPAIVLFKLHKDNPIMEPIPLSTLVALKFIKKNFGPVTPARENRS